MKLSRWAAAGAVAALAAGVAACGSSGSSGGSGGGTSAASGTASGGTLVVETSFVLKTLDPTRMFETTGLMADRVLYDTFLTHKGRNQIKPLPQLTSSAT